MSLAALLHAAPTGAAERVLADRSQTGIRVRVVEFQAPNTPEKGVSLQAAHELLVEATAAGVRITSLRITPGKNVSRASGGNPVSGYLYLDAMPNRTLRAIVLAENSAQAFNWTYQIGFDADGQKHSHRHSVESSSLATKNHASSMPAMDVSALLAAPSASKAAKTDADDLASPVGNLASLLADPAMPASVDRAPDSAASGADESLQNALVLRDRERERKAYVAKVESFRSGLIEEQKLLQKIVATASREHVQIDQRRAEAERRREAEAESAKDTQLMWGLVAGVAGTVIAHNAGIANAGELGGRLGTSIAQGNAAGGFAEYSSGLNSGMGQRLAELEAQRQVAASQPQPISQGQRFYRESVRRSEAGRQQLIRQGKLADRPPSPAVANILNTSPQGLAASGGQSRRNPPLPTEQPKAPAPMPTQRLSSGPDSCTTFAGVWARYAGKWHKDLVLEAGCSGGEYCVQTLRDWNNSDDNYVWDCESDKVRKEGLAGRIKRWSVNGNTVSVWLDTGTKLNLPLKHRDGQPWLDDMIRHHAQRR